MTSFTAPTNRLALISLTAAVFMLACFCIGVFPIPLTAWVCYPVALLFAGLAIFTGSSALRQIRSTGERGRLLALVGIWTSVLTILASLCFTTFSLLLLTSAAEYIQRFWQQMRPG